MFLDVSGVLANNPLAPTRLFQPPTHTTTPLLSLLLLTLPTPTQRWWDPASFGQHSRPFCSVTSMARPLACRTRPSCASISSCRGACSLRVTGRVFTAGGAGYPPVGRPWRGTLSASGAASWKRYCAGARCCIRRCSTGNPATINMGAMYLCVSRSDAAGNVQPRHRQLSCQGKAAEL